MVSLMAFSHLSSNIEISVLFLISLVCLVFLLCADVWASLDGGYSWGECVTNAEFSNRQFQYTVLDDEGYLYVMGGRETASGQRLVNDVWKSVYSYNDVNEVASRCGLFVPSCGVGLKCLPEDEGFMQGGWGVSCAACPYKVDLSNTSPSTQSNTMTICQLRQYHYLLFSCPTSHSLTVFYFLLSFVQYLSSSFSSSWRLLLP